MAMTAFSIFMTLFYSNIIVPLFNKQKPLDAGVLRDAIENFASRAGFKLKNIYVIDGSKRSKKANAYFTGFGPKKRIVLYDTLMKDFTTEEIVAILAHEIGHYKKKHVVYGLITSILSSGVLLYIMSLIIGNPDVAGALGAGEASFHMGILSFGILYSPFSTLLGIAGNYISRRHEYAADRYAAKQYHAETMAVGLKKLHVLHLSNLRPHPFTVFITYSHPTLLQRLAALVK
jgi:STE24 endopeptidase